MNEKTWLSNGQADALLDFVGTRSTRKLRLFACACCRRVWNRLGHDSSQTAVIVSELFADGRTSDENLLQAAYKAEDALSELDSLPDPLRLATEDPNRPTTNIAAFSAQAAFLACCNPDDILSYFDQVKRVLNLVCEAAGYAVNEAFYKRGGGLYAHQPLSVEENDYLRGFESEQKILASLLRDIFANPFRPVTLDPRWLTADVTDLAKAIYDDRAFDRMPILGDALMDAGCDSDDIIQHCRGPGPHVRGCWVVDLLLGKEG